MVIVLGGLDTSVTVELLACWVFTIDKDVSAWAYLLSEYIFYEFMNLLAVSAILSLNLLLFGPFYA